MQNFQTRQFFQCGKTLHLTACETQFPQLRQPAETVDGGQRLADQGQLFQSCHVRDQAQIVHLPLCHRGAVDTTDAIFIKRYRRKTVRIQVPAEIQFADLRQLPAVDLIRSIAQCPSDRPLLLCIRKAHGKEALRPVQFQHRRRRGGCGGRGCFDRRVRQRYGMDAPRGQSAQGPRRGEEKEQ